MKSAVILRTLANAAAEPAAQLRILMVHWDGGGNLPPQRALARELKRRGHDVHVLTHDVLAKTVSEDGGVFHALKTAVQWDAARPHSQGEEIAFIRQNVAGSSSYAADFLATYHALQPDVCVIDTMLITSLGAAIEHGLRIAVLNHLAWIEKGVVQGSLSSIAANLPGRSAGSTYFGLLSRVPLVLATSYPEFGTQTAIAPHVRFVGPIREPVADTRWPRRFPDRPFVLVSLSTMFQGQEKTLRNICAAMATLLLEVLVTTGRGISPDAVPAWDAIEVRSFVAHDAILSHADLVVTHAGLGTLLFSAGAGVPTLCFPNGRDQDDNAARVEALGLGRAMSRDSTDVDINKAIVDILRDRVMRSTCRSFAARLKRFGNLTGAADHVQELARANA